MLHPHQHLSPRCPRRAARPPAHSVLLATWHDMPLREATLTSRHPRRRAAREHALRVLRAASSACRRARLLARPRDVTTCTHDIHPSYNTASQQKSEPPRAHQANTQVQERKGRGHAQRLRRCHRVLHGMKSKTALQQHLCQAQSQRCERPRRQAAVDSLRRRHHPHTRRGL